MGRTKLIPDTDIFRLLRTLLAQGGDKAVAFSSVGRACGLAPATLVQRFGTRDGMVRAALLAAWDELDALLQQLDVKAEKSAKGALQILKSLSRDGSATDASLRSADLRDAETRARAGQWREKVEAALATRLGGPSRGRDAAAVLFAAWQGQAMWQSVGSTRLKLKDAIKRIT
jgi:AcrR family transcriptional regulator